MAASAATLNPSVKASSKTTTDRSVEMVFAPVPSLCEVFTAPVDKQFIAILGPIGSTKTTTCLYKLLALAAAQEPSPDGIRRTRFAICRNTLVSLKQTVLKDALSIFGEIAEWRQQDGMIRFRVADIDSEWLFLPLETAQDQKRLLSLQLSSVYANEAREIDFALLINTFSRCGRFPSPMHGGVACTNPVLLFDSNMGVAGSALYKFLEEDPPDELLYIHQPSALSPQADWTQYLRPGYYQGLMIGAKKAWIDTHVHSQWSTDLSGEPVFAEVFSPDIHVFHAYTPLYRPTPVNKKHGLVVGLDPGLNPAAVVTQMTDNGRWMIHAETYAENMLFGVFLDELLIPLVQSPRFIGRGVTIVADPASAQRAATTGTTARGMMLARGLDVQLATTNDIKPRLNVIEQWLTAMRRDVPQDGGDTASVPYNPHNRGAANVASYSTPTGAICIDRGCQILIEGLESKYRYKRKKVTNELEAEPEKKHPISDVMDCLGYAALGLAIPRIVRRTQPGFHDRQAKAMQKVPQRKAWG